MCLYGIYELFLKRLVADRDVNTVQVYTEKTKFFRLFTRKCTVFTICLFLASLALHFCRSHNQLHTISSITAVTMIVGAVGCIWFTIDQKLAQFYLDSKPVKRNSDDIKRYNQFQNIQHNRERTIPEKLSEILKTVKSTQSTIDVTKGESPC
eukprot:UN27894